MYCAAAHALVRTTIPPYDVEVVRRAGDVSQTSEGDWTVDLKAPAASNLTVELETADLKELSSAGTITPMTVELSTLDIEEINPGKTVAEIGRIVGESSSVIVDLSDPLPPPSSEPVPPSNSVTTKPRSDALSLTASPISAPSTNAVVASRRMTPRSTAVPRAHAQTNAEVDVNDDRGGRWLVVVVYLLATAALATSIYVRFFT